MVAGQPRAQPLKHAGEELDEPARGRRSTIGFGPGKLASDYERDVMVAGQGRRGRAALHLRKNTYQSRGALAFCAAEPWCIIRFAAARSGASRFAHLVIRHQRSRYANS